MVVAAELTHSLPATRFAGTGPGALGAGELLGDVSYLRNY